MKAVRVLEYGGQLVFDEVPTPRIAADEVLVKVTGTAVNHVDLVKAAGVARQVLPIDLPWIPGHEFSGVVDQIGSDVAGYVDLSPFLRQPVKSRKPSRRIDSWRCHDENSPRN